MLAATSHFVGKARLFAIATVITSLIPLSAAAVTCSGTLPTGDHRAQDVIVDGNCTVDRAGVPL
jgi:hypothetical protein